MLPPPYGILADLALVGGGALACFAGYRLFRIVLGIYGFVLGAMFASSMMGATSTGAQVVAAIVGGLIGAAPSERWVPITWFVIGLIGAAVQLNITARQRGTA